MIYTMNWKKECMAALQKGYSANKPFRERFITLGRHFLAVSHNSPDPLRYIEQYHNHPTVCPYG